MFDRYLFPPGRFPEFRWKNRERVERLLGAIPLSAEFYDSAYAPVTSASRPGRYGVAVHGTTPDGFRVTRFVTLYCCNADLDDYSPDVPISIEPLAGFGIAPERWALYRKQQRRFSFGSLMLFPKHDPDAAVFLAGLAELMPGGRETPRLRDRSWWTEFKRRRDGSHRAALKPPPPRIAPTSSATLPSAQLYSPAAGPAYP